MTKATVDAVKADAKTVREILDKNKYEIDVFQREYAWERKQIEQLLADLEFKFLSDYDESDERKNVQNYSKYYLGSIIISLKDNKRSIIDGQQRLTSITLLLMYLNNLQKSQNEKVQINDLIFSEKYSEKSYNLQIPDRKDCIDAIYNNQEYEITGKSESVKNIVERYNDIEELFPQEIKGKALPYFIDWLIDNVMFVEIKTYSDEDAYTIFETMNDRGLNLTPTDMLKGYLLSNVESPEKKIALNELWKNRMADLHDIDKEKDLEFFKSWLRAKYAETIRPGKKGAENEDFEKISTRFHSWVRDNKNLLGLNGPSSFYDFIKIQFDFYSKLHLKIYEASMNLQKGLEHVFYVESRGFPVSFYNPLIMSPIKVTDDAKTIDKKIALVARFLETFIVYRSVNYRTLGSSSIRYTMFSLIKEIRNKDIQELVKILKEKIIGFEENLDGVMNFRLHQQNKRLVQFILARITNHIESKCGVQSDFKDYISREIKKPYEIEHIWANKFAEHREEFNQEHEFEDFRNKLGALILIPEGFNQSYGDLPYEDKLSHYFGQNLLAKTLSNQCYENNPTFMKYKNESKIPFKPYEHFKKQDIIERQKLYQKICEEIWSLEGFDEIVNS
ncbi:MAG: DUF262 domain-containing protein [Nitrosarchaeum sp.]|nr:DUF262 domain-containing protein [Nitrosarchaeum sp.]